MRALILAASAIGALMVAPPASADPSSSALAYSPPFVAHVFWTSWPQSNQLRSLQIYPTTTGRAAARQLGSISPEADEAWSEVLALAPDAASPGMHEQFRYHWDFAEILLPGKPSWNLEPWRPVVDNTTMANSGCNPGGGGEQF